MRKPKFPKTLIVHRVADIDDEDVLITAETPEDISEEHADQPVAIYQLLAIGNFRVEKCIDGRVVQKFGIKLDDKKTKRR